MKALNVYCWMLPRHFLVGMLVVGAALLPLPGRADQADKNPPAVAAEDQKLFEREIAPIFARHCIECHNASTAEGGLDLSHEKAALSGGDSGESIRRSNSEESLLWQYVESDEMPQNRAPLSDKQKSLLKRWIERGAVWTLDQIDPDAYVHEGAADELWVQRLTVPEYIATVQSTTGVDIEKEARRVLPRDERADGFTNTAYNLSVDLEHIQAYALLAKTIVDQMDTQQFAAKFVDCTKLDRKCTQQLIERMGRALLRGPLSEQEVEAYQRVVTAVSEAGGDFEEATGYILQAMLQSPRFVYRIERQSGDGTPQAVEGYELASRLSYILWGAPPDAKLLEAAEAGQLSEAKQLQSQGERMLRDPRAIERSVQFISEWIDLGRLGALRPNPDRFPHWDAQLAEDMQNETTAYFRELVWEEDRPLWELMNAPFTYATPRLAHHYGLYASHSSGKKEHEREIADRVDKGLQVLYTFARGSGDVIRDRSGHSERMDLKIEDPAAVRWVDDGLEIHSTTLLRSLKSSGRLTKALRRSKSLTLEAWVTPVDTTQSGPARILTLSEGSSQRNFTLGQSGDEFEVRLRTTKTDNNGLPGLSSGSAKVATRPMHVVFTRQANGETVLYLDGRRVASDRSPGDFGNWNQKFQLALANETSGDRAWMGTMHLAAVYDRPLSAEEVRQNHAAGAGTLEDQLASLAISAALESIDPSDVIALYRFDEGQGKVIHDVSKAGKGLDLNIEDLANVRWSTAGLDIYGGAQIRTAEPAKGLSDAIKKSKAFAVEAWITPANATQDGPARIVTLSADSGRRNFTLGQDGDRFDARIRAKKTDGNGIPSISGNGGSAIAALTHVVLAKEAAGVARLYVNGVQQASHDVGSELTDWDDGFRLAIGNELSGDRPWQGQFHLLAIYNRALSAEEIQSRGGGTTRFDLADNPARGGLLTQGSVLTIGGDDASMVARGLFVLHDLLYSRVGNPPACVDTTPIPAKPGMSNRDMAEVRLADASCTGCHTKFEPLAFGLERFDGLGAYQENDEYGNQLREDGEILFPDRSDAVAYKSSAELMDLLAGSDRVRMAITRKIVQFSLGRPLTAGDLPELKRIHQESVDNGGTYRALMTALVTSDLVRKTRTEAQ